MARKVILDVDPGIDDAVALTMALFNPDLDVVAVTAVAGNVKAEQATRNVQAVIERLDPPRWPRIGTAVEPEFGCPVNSQRINGEDGLGNVNYEVAELHNRHPSDKVICDEVRTAPEEVTIICLGPLTNIARAFQRDPALASQVGQLIIMGGAVASPGNVSAAAEFNMFFDPESARTVFRSRTTKTLVPLDVTQNVVMTYDFLDQLPPEYTKAGRMLRAILPFAFRSHHRELGVEGVHLHDSVALLACTNAALFTTSEMAGDVEVSGELTTGATVFDRRTISDWRPNMDVALEIDSVGARDAIVRALTRAGEAG